VNLDLTPFQRINPCGYEGLEMTQLVELGEGPGTVAEAAAALEPHLLRALGFGAGGVNPPSGTA
jgi:lipoyl(octanoyl) transferase